MGEKYVSNEIYDLMKKELKTNDGWTLEQEDSKTGLNTSTKQIFDSSLPCYKVENALPNYPIKIVWGAIKDVVNRPKWGK